MLVIETVLYEMRREKTGLLGLSNQAVKPQKMARGLKFQF